MFDKLGQRETRRIREPQHFGNAGIRAAAHDIFDETAAYFSACGKLRNGPPVVPPNEVYISS